MITLEEYRALKTIFWIIVVIYIGMLGVYLLIKTIKKADEEKSKKRMNFAWVMFMFFYVLTRLFFLLSDFENDLNGHTILYHRYVAIAYIFFILALWNIIFVVEKYALNLFKSFISYMIVIFLIIDIVFFVILYPEVLPIVGIYANYALLYCGIVILIYIYIYLAKHSKGKLKIKSIISIIGLITATIGETLDSRFLPRDLALLSPYIFALGISIFFYAQFVITAMYEME